jgi:hypothetical protein
MKKMLIFAAASALFAANAFATYIVVMKNGTTYRAKAKWTVSNGKALIALESGQTLQVDPALIDEAASDRQTRSGLGDAKVIDLGNANTEAQQAPRAQQPSLGASIKLRNIGGPASLTPPPSASATPTPNGTSPAGVSPAAGGGMLSQEAVDKFAKAYENVGLFEQKLTATGPHSLRAELTADTEDKVFNAISATSFLMVRNAGMSGVQIDQVELFMKTTTGGSSGRFQMNRDDAQALDSKKLSQQEYFVRRVIY